MHPITAQLTQQSASTNKHPTDAKDLSHTLPSFAGGAGSGQKESRSFQHFFEINAIDAPEIEMPITENVDAIIAPEQTSEVRNRTAGQVGVNEQPNPELPTFDSIDEHEVPAVKKSIADQTDPPTLFASQPLLPGQNLPRTLVGNADISLHQTQYSNPTNETPLPTGKSPVLSVMSERQTQAPAESAQIPDKPVKTQDALPIHGATIKDGSQVVPVKEMRARQRPVQSSLELIMSLPALKRSAGLTPAPTQPEKIQLSLSEASIATPSDIRQPTQPTIIERAKPVDPTRHAILVDQTSKNTFANTDADIDRPTPKSSEHLVPQTQPIPIVRAQLTDGANITYAPTPISSKLQASFTKDTPVDPTRFAKMEFQQTVMPAPPPAKQVAISSAASITTPAVHIQPHSKIDIFAQTETSFTTSTEVLPPSQLQHITGTGRIDLPIHVARQLAEVVQHMPSRPVEITLSPEELGRVRLSVVTSETGIVVNVLAERPETLDLLRRHIDQLSQEFQDLGYQDIAFSFAGAGTDTDNDGDNTQPEDHSGPHAKDVNQTDATATQIHLSADPAAGLDLRL
ncbi:MAG: flagellar hook-length control protein FliK [Sulfitobacter sp.]